MPKTHRTISVDVDIVEFYMKSSHNISRICNDALRVVMNQEVCGANALNVVAKRRQLEKVEKELVELKAEASGLRSAIKDFESKREEREIARLKRIEDEALLKKSCKHCGASIKEFMRVGGKEFHLCLDCMSTMDSGVRDKYEVGVDA